jgi:hypothetical protein
VCQKEDDGRVGGSERRLKTQKENIFQNPKKNHKFYPHKERKKNGKT